MSKAHNSPYAVIHFGIRLKPFCPIGTSIRGTETRQDHFGANWVKDFGA
jgi:hypothetical protein